MGTTAEDIRAQFAELQELADSGNDIAVKVIGWFDQVSDHAETAGCFPPEHAAALVLMADAGHTTTLFWGARLLRWQIDHPGEIPSHYRFSVDVEFEAIR